MLADGVRAKNKRDAAQAEQGGGDGNASKRRCPAELTVEGKAKAAPKAKNKAKPKAAGKK